MSSAASTSLQPWQFFVLTALACATVLTFVAGGAGPISVVMFTVLMFAAALVGLAALRTVRPLVTPQDERSGQIGARTKAVLEREKALALRAIKELEFDKAMGKVSDEDFREMSGRLRSRAGRIMRQMDAGAGYRAQVERDLARKMADKRVGESGSATASADRATRTCAACQTANDGDARFCKGCGAKL
jgi:hypothetical protein